jgi:acetolactate synthase-1/3 small subunit
MKSINTVRSFKANAFSSAGLTSSGFSTRIPLVTRGSEDVIEQITKQLNKLIDIVKLIDLADALHVERELMLVKVKTSDETRGEINR